MDNCVVVESGAVPQDPILTRYVESPSTDILASTMVTKI